MQKGTVLYGREKRGPVNLEFRTVDRVERNGRSFLLQKVCLQGAKQFWGKWRKLKPRLKKLITIRYEALSGGGKVVPFAYRLYPVDRGTHGEFNCSYSLRNISKLLPYQPEAVQYLCAAIMNHGSAMDGSDTGTGKTYVALAVARELALKPLIICKIVGKASWKRACRYMNITPVMITNWERIKLGKTKFLQRKRVNSVYKWEYFWNVPYGTILIFDECHVANNYPTQNSLMYIASKGMTTLSLSATFADRASRMLPYFHTQNIIDKENFSEWLKGLGIYKNEYDVDESLSDFQDMKRIHKMIYPSHGYRLSYDDREVKKYFPDGVYRTEVVTINEADTNKQNHLYREAVKEAEKYRSMAHSAERLVKRLRYRQFAELAKAPVLVELTNNYIAEGKSVVIFVNYRKTLTFLSKALKTKSLIYGNQESEGIFRENVINRFQDDKSRIVIAMVDAGGQSISLHDITGRFPRISLICPTYNPVSLKQVLGRTRRAGSKSTPVMKLVYAAATVEESVADTVAGKLSSIHALNDGDLMEPDLFGIDKGKTCIK